MTQINAKIDDGLLEEFRDIIYKKSGLKKGDFKHALENAMVDYVLKYSDSTTAKQLAKRFKDEKR